MGVPHVGSSMQAPYIGSPSWASPSPEIHDIEMEDASSTLPYDLIDSEGDVVMEDVSSAPFPS